MDLLKKSYFVVFVVLLLALSACGSSGDDASEGKNSSSNDGEKIVLKASSQAPPASPYSQGFDALLDEIEKASDDLIEFERYYSESLTKADNKVNALSSGIADIAAFMPSYTPGLTPLGNIVSNPGLWEDSWVGSKAINELYHTHSELQEELEKENVKWVGQFTFPSYYVVSTEDVKSFDDLEGLRLIATGQMATLAEALGATVVGMPITDAYDAMQRGTIDGAIYGYTSSVTYGLDEVATSVWALPLGSPGGIIGMNLDVWNEIPENVQKEIENISQNIHPELYHEIYQIDGDEESIKKFEEHGVNINPASEEDVVKFREIVQEVIWDTWIEQQEDNDLPGRKILEDLVQFADKYAEENPFK